jgi:cobalt-zinc-cadmium resistance protein CzcA
VTLRWPQRLRESESAILEIPVDVTGHQVTEGPVAQQAGTPFSGPSTGISTIGTSQVMPALTGSQVSGALINLSTTPQRRLRELVIPVGPDGERDSSGRFVRPGAVMIYRDQGSRMIAVKFGVRGRDLAGTVAEAQAKVAPLIKVPYRVEWSGEIRQMVQAERRLVIIIGISLGLIFILLYLALGSFLDVLVIGTSVAMMSLGGIWALVLTHTNFNISAAVGFISIFGVAVMDGLLLVSYFNQLRRQGLPLREAILQGAEKRVRPITMTALTAVFGLLPAALSTRIGSQAQRPLAIVVVGGMLTTLFLMRYLMPVLYSFYGHREPPGDDGGLAH